MKKAMDEHQMNGKPSMTEIELKSGEMSAGSKASFSGDDKTPAKTRRNRRGG